MPGIKVLAEKNIKEIIERLIERKGWTISDDASLVLAERGQTPPEKGVVILFGPGIGEETAGLIGVLLSQDGKESIDGNISDKKYLTGKKNDRYKVLEFNMIRYFHSDGNTVYASTMEGPFEVEGKLYEIERELRNNGFVRIGKSCVVNLFWITEIIPWFGGRLLLKLKEKPEELEVARIYAPGFKEILGM